MDKSIRYRIVRFFCNIFKVKEGEFIPKYLYPVLFILFPIRALFMIEARPLKYDLLSDSIEIRGFKMSVRFLEDLTRKERIIRFIPDQEKKNITCELVGDREVWDIWTNCEFEGPPPLGFESWRSFCESPRKKGVRVEALK